MEMNRVASEGMGTWSAAAVAKRVQSICDEAVRLQRLEVEFAVTAIALAALQVHPYAAVLLLEDSDQGDWLTAVQWRDEAGEVHDLDEMNCDGIDALATHLYTPGVESVAGVTAVRSGRHESARYEIDLAVAASASSQLMGQGIPA